ncbi:sugar transferase [Lagierella sp.]|uniref:sugar transferase n=1 Tax=Lagierella sp. TaxID=2849657 RepID=UPI00263A374E|nr:sugar transferase [Lagierella sp.]
MLYSKYIKRFLDIVLSLLAIIILSPLLIILYILVRVKLGKPAIFKQVRPGKDEKLFTMYKFRTMTNEKDENGDLLPDDQRLPKFGRVLRSTSLDELPELFNILKGDMSIIGPRPLLVKYLPYYTSEEKIRHKVRPGLTGLAQINGRNTIQWSKRFEYDIKYVKNINFITDVNIFFNTIAKVLARKDINVRSDCKVEKLIDKRKKSITSLDDSSYNIKEGVNNSKITEKKLNH